LIISLGEIWRHNRGAIVPRKPVSLYRYVEGLIEVAVARKYGLKSMLEVGPGTYPAIDHFARDEFEQVALADYNEKVLNFCQGKTAGRLVEKILIDIEEPRALARTGRQWDYIISNGIIEHIKNDAQHVQDLYDVLAPGGVLACLTVLHPSLFNDWDRAVGHYRRYRLSELRPLFGMFSQVQIIQTALLQELVRPLFFSRIRHLLSNTTEENNLAFSDEVASFSKPPYAPIFGLVRYLLPIYLVLDWIKSPFFGGIVLVLARR
jgi:SAM-dependent methyltransferase